MIASEYLLDVVFEAGLELVVKNALALGAEVETLKNVPEAAHLCFGERVRQSNRRRSNKNKVWREILEYSE